MIVTKEAFLAKMTTLYTMGNLTDSDRDPNSNWTKPSMAHDLCAGLDKIIHALTVSGVLTQDETQAFYDNM